VAAQDRGSSARPPGPRRSGPRRPGGAVRQPPATAGPKAWGSLGRKGAGRLTAENFDARDGVGATGRDTRPDPRHTTSTWQRVDEPDRAGTDGGVRRSGSGDGPRRAKAAPKRGRSPRSGGAGSGGAEAKGELAGLLGAEHGERANERLRDAARAFERDRFEEARSLLRPVAERAPQAASVRELLGLSYYRLGRWKEAVRELEAFRELTGSTEQHPVLADALRALRRHAEVEVLWDDLRESSPAADLVAEGRIVMAGSLADRGRLADSIALLEQAQRKVKRPQVHHLRQAYALADLYERAGDATRARELFRWVSDQLPDFADAADRLRSLS